jgi:hypothetical protein
LHEGPFFINYFLGARARFPLQAPFVLYYVCAAPVSFALQDKSLLARQTLCKGLNGGFPFQSLALKTVKIETSIVLKFKLVLTKMHYVTLFTS